MPGSPRLHEAGDPQRRIGPHLERIAEVVVETAKDRVDGPQTGDGLQEDALVANRQVAAFHEWKAELPRKVGVFEVGLVVWSGCEHHDVRRTAVRRRAGEQDLPQLVKEGRQRADAQCMKRVGQYARHDRAILQRVADTGRRLRTGSDNTPFTVSAAREVERNEMQKHAVAGTNTVAGAQEAWMPEDERRRDQPFAEQGLRAVKVGRDGVQQSCALPQPAPEPFPLLRLHDQRKNVEAPRTLLPVGGRVDVVSDAVLVDLTIDAFLCLGQVLRVQLGRGREFRPRLAQRSAAGAHLVEVPVGHDILRRQRKPCHSGVRRSNV